MCRKRPFVVLLIGLCFSLTFATLFFLILGLANASITIRPQYPATLVSSASFTYNLTSTSQDSAEFSLWQYTEERHFTNTSVATGLQDPGNPWTYYHFVSTFEVGCAYYGYPLVLDVGEGLNFLREPQGDNSLQLTSPGCAAVRASRAFGVVVIPIQLFTSLLATIATVIHASASLNQELGVAVTDITSVSKSSLLFQVLVGLDVVFVLPLLVCLIVWTQAPEFSGGQWNVYLYLYLAGIGYTLAVRWSVVGYNLWVVRRIVFHEKYATDRMGAQVDGHGFSVVAVVPEAATPSSASSLILR